MINLIPIISSAAAEGRFSAMKFLCTYRLKIKYFIVHSRGTNLHCYQWTTSLRIES